MKEHWKLTKVNQEYKMTKIEGKKIAVRNLTILEKIRYFYKFFNNSKSK